MAHWIIDRTINIDEFKTRAVLSLLLETPRKPDNVLENILHAKQVLKNEADGALRRRWYTYLRNYGLLLGDDVTEMGRLYAKAMLSLQEVVLLQLIKKRIQLENGTYIYPFKVFTKLLRLLKDVSLEQCYITRREFAHYICNVINDTDEEIERLKNIIIESRNQGFIQTDISSEHYDIWFNTLSQTGMFEYLSKYSLYLVDFDMLEKIYNYYNNYPNDVFAYGSFDFGLIRDILEITKSNTEFNYNKAKKYDRLLELLNDFFFNYTDLHRLEDKYFSYKKNYRGVQDTLACLNLDVTNIGKYKNYKNYKNIVFNKMLKSNDQEIVKIAQLMMEYSKGERTHMSVMAYEFKPRVDKKYELNTIIYGAPGTGKTYMTANYALGIIKNEEINVATSREDVMAEYNKYVASGQIVFTTFHQSYNYEDFVQGIRPVSKDGAVVFEPRDGILKRLVDVAIENPQKEYVLIIDEINRANISKVFGELITLIEADKRLGEANAISTVLPSGERFIIPNNIYIVGTMNSADKSISLIDVALRRRFDFIEVVPNGLLIENETLKSVFIKINSALVDALDSTDLLIGHAYFMSKNSSDLCDILNKNIIPLLYEYFYDQGKKVENLLKNALSDLNIDVLSAKVGRVKVVKRA